jgi:hypothetical protein
MTDSNKPNLEDRIDRYVRRELTAEEARQLAQESLDAPELFEELTFSALVKTALSEGSVPRSKIVRFPRKARFVVAGATAAAAVVLVSLYAVRSSFLRPNQPSLAQNHSRETSASSHLKPALGFSANPGQPVLLASDLPPEPVGREGTQVFRGPAPASRAPRPAGKIVSIEDGEVTINLGSLDGLAKGSELQVFRDERSTQPIGRLIVTTVFRERARGRIPAGQEIAVNHQVRVAGAALERLAALEYQAGSLQAAEKHYQSAIDGQGSFGEQSVALNNLAVLHMLRGDYDGAEAPLNQAVAKSPKTNILYGRSVNNLGVLAELRGDRRKAEALYTDAQRAFAGVADSPAQDRRAVETNLARIRGFR